MKRADKDCKICNGKGYIVHYPANKCYIDGMAYWAACQRGEETYRVNQCKCFKLYKETEGE